MCFNFTVGEDKYPKKVHIQEARAGTFSFFIEKTAVVHCFLILLRLWLQPAADGNLRPLAYRRSTSLLLTVRLRGAEQVLC